VAEKLRHLRAEAARPVLLLPDPDTGIEPVSGGSRKHVLRSELASLYSALAGNDVLAVYQHAPRQFDPNWIDEKRVLLAHALSVNPVLILPLSCLEVARDVVLLTVEGSA
jgi:hypothetical protein